MNELLKLIHKAEEGASTDEALERKRAFSLFFLASKSPQKGDFLEQKYSVASFRSALRAPSRSAASWVRVSPGYRKDPGEQRHSPQSQCSP
jgi:hypothetical protein